MANKDESGNWIDAAGQSVPVEYIDPVRKQRDRVVEKQIRQAFLLQERMRKFKAGAQEGISKYVAWLVEKKGAKAISKGGNLQLTGFSGDKQILIKVNKLINFDERLTLAKELLDDCFERWAEGGNENLKVAVFAAFKVDQKGNLNVQQILGLRDWKIKDKTWDKAMDLITEAITITGTRKYLQFRTKADKDSEWETIRLDLAGV